MRTIIAGSRTCTDYIHVRRAVEACGWVPTVVLSGGTKGADRLGLLWADDHETDIEIFPADWESDGRKAGYQRNERMAHSAEALIALWDGSSKGTGHMIDIAKRRGLRIYIHPIGGDSE